MEQNIKDGVKMLKTKLKEIDEDLADTRYNDEAWYKQDVKFRDFIEDVLYKLEEPKSETPIPDTESLAEADWKECDRDYTNGYGLTYMEWIEQYKKNKK